MINLIPKTGRATSQLGRRRQRSLGRGGHGRRHPSGRYLPAPDRRTAQPDDWANERMVQSVSPAANGPPSREPTSPASSPFPHAKGPSPPLTGTPISRRPRTREGQPSARHHRGRVYPLFPLTQGPVVGMRPQARPGPARPCAQGPGRAQSRYRAQGRGQQDPTRTGDAPGGVVQTRQGLGTMRPGRWRLVTCKPARAWEQDSLRTGTHLLYKGVPARTGSPGPPWFTTCSRGGTCQHAVGPQG